MSDNPSDIERRLLAACRDYNGEDMPGEAEPFPVTCALLTEAAEALSSLRLQVEGLEKERDEWKQAATVLSDSRKANRALVHTFRNALKRLGSMEAFAGARAIKIARDEELVARIDFARATLQDNQDDRDALS